MFRIKNEYKLEWQTPETMKLFGSTKKLIDKTKDRENVPSLEVVEVVLVQCNLADNQSEVLYTFTLNKSYAYLLNVESSNVVFLKTYDTECDEPIIKFADQNCTPLEIEDVIASILRSHCNYGNAYIVVKGRIRATGTKDDNKWNEKVTFRNNAPFRSCISLMNNTFIDNAKDFDSNMLMYNFL